MDKLTKRALQAQVEAAVRVFPAPVPQSETPNQPPSSQQNVDRENSNKVKQEEGVLSVARIKAKARTVRFSSLHFP